MSQGKLADMVQDCGALDYHTFAASLAASPAEEAARDEHARWVKRALLEMPEEDPVAGEAMPQRAEWGP